MVFIGLFILIRGFEVVVGLTLLINFMVFFFSDYWLACEYHKACLEAKTPDTVWGRETETSKEAQYRRKAG